MPIYGRDDNFGYYCAIKWPNFNSSVDGGVDEAEGVGNSKRVLPDSLHFLFSTFIAIMIEYHGFCNYDSFLPGWGMYYKGSSGDGFTTIKRVLGL